MCLPQSFHLEVEQRALLSQGLLSTGTDKASTSIPGIEK